MNDALGIALTQGTIDLVRELIRYGADPNAHATFCHAAFEGGNEDLTLALLSSPSHRLDARILGPALIAAVQGGNNDLVALILGHRTEENPDLRRSILCALTENKPGILGTLLSDVHARENTSGLNAALDAACAVPINAQKPIILDMLLCAGASPQVDGLRHQLLAAIDTNAIDVISVLVRHGMSLNIQGAAPIILAVENSQVEALRVLLQGAVTRENLSRAVSHVPEEASEELALEIAGQLFDKGATGYSCGKLLANAVLRYQIRLIELLIRNRSNVDYDHAQVVRTAIARGDYTLLSLLMNGNCSKNVLVKALPAALDVEDSSQRHFVVATLLNKGVAGLELDMALLRVVADRNSQDLKMIKMLRQAGASVNALSDGNNAIHISVKRMSLEILHLLCDGRSSPAGQPSSEVLSAAVPLALAASPTVSLNKSINVLTLLLQNGAQNPVISEALVTTIQKSYHLDILKLLLHHGADVNHREGLPVEEALNQSSLDYLDTVCKTNAVNVKTFSRILSLALRQTALDLDRLQILIRSGSSHRTVSSRAVISETSREQPRPDVVNLLLEYGASPNYEDGAAMYQATVSGHLQIVQILTDSGSVQHHALERSFKASRALEDLQVRHGFAKTLLGKAQGSNIGQDDALIAESKEPANIARTKHIDLLLRHSANINHNGGVCVIHAILNGDMALLSQLFEHNPDQNTLSAAFKAARRKQCSVLERLQIYRPILDHGFHGQPISDALVEAVQETPSSETLVQLLLECGADVNTASGQALMNVCKTGQVELARILCNQSPSQSTVEQAFQATRESSMADDTRTAIFQCLQAAHDVSCEQISAALLEMVQRGSITDDLLNFVIDQGASLDYKEGQVMLKLIVKGDLKTINKLLTHLPASHQTLYAGFACGLALEQSQRLLLTIELLEAGLQSTHLTPLLQRFVQEGDLHLVQLVLRSGADVMVSDGQCFASVATLGDVELLRVLLDGNVDILVALKAILTQVKSTRHVVKALEECLDRLAHAPEPHENEALFLAIEHFPRDDGPTRLMLEHGFIAWQPRHMALKGREESEPVTPLIWALYQPGSGVDNSVITALLQMGNDVAPGYVSPELKTNALIRMAKHSQHRHSVMKRLLELEAGDISAQNAKGRSALFYASRSGDQTMVRLLVEAGAEPNDGSLHAAAKNAQPEVVRYLLSKDHDPAYPCHLHGGRTALAELCLHGEDTGLNWELRATEVMKALVAEGTRLGERYEGKTVLHLALDNDSALPITKVLLKRPEVWKQINSEQFMFTDTDGTCYSPDMYAERLYEGARSGMRQTLVNLLRAKNCKSRLFSTRGKQISGSCGLPDFMEEAEQRRALLDRDQSDLLRRQKEYFAFEVETEKERNRLAIEHSNAQHSAKLLQDREREAYAIQAGDRAHLRELTQTRERAGEQLRLEDERHVAQQRQQQELARQQSRLAIEHINAQHQAQMRQDQAREAYQIESGTRQHMRELAQTRERGTEQRRIEDAQRQAALTFRLESARIEEATEEARVRRTRGLLIDKEAAMRRMLDREDASVSHRRRELTSAAEAARGVGNLGFHETPGRGRILGLVEE